MSDSESEPKEGPIIDISNEVTVGSIINQPIIDDDQMQDLVDLHTDDDISSIVQFKVGDTVEVKWYLEFDGEEGEEVWLPAVIKQKRGIYTVVDEETGDTAHIPVFRVRFDDDETDSRVHLINDHYLFNFEMDTTLAWRQQGSDWDEGVHCEECNGVCISFPPNAKLDDVKTDVRTKITEALMGMMEPHREVYEKLPPNVQIDIGTMILDFQTKNINMINDFIQKSFEKNKHCIPWTTIEPFLNEWVENSHKHD